MRKFKLDKITSTRLSALAMAGIIFATSISVSGCSKKEGNQSEGTSVVVSYDEAINLTNLVRENIKLLFPNMNEEIINNTSLIILLDELAKEDENGKINADIISNFKTKVDTDNMMGDFNSFLDTLEQSMIENESLISTSDLVINNDKEILKRIEKVTSNIINGTEEEIKTNFDLIYTLFVLEDEMTYDDLTFNVRDLSYSGRAIASAYARTAAYFAKDYIKEDEYSKIDNRTNNQNNKAYIKTKLEILANCIDEKSLVNVKEIFEEEYKSTNSFVNSKLKTEKDSIVNLVNYLNLEYLNSDEVSTKDKNDILGEYSDKKVSDTLITIEAISKYNSKNTSDIILFSNLLVDSYKETQTGKLDGVLLDYIQFNSIMLLETTDEKSTKEEIFDNPYFKNIYKYFTKQNFVHSYNKDNKVEVNYQDASDGAKLVANQIVFYTLNQRSNIFGFTGFEEKINTNLTETIQYVQNVVTGECEKVELNEFVKTK